MKKYKFSIFLTLILIITLLIGTIPASAASVKISKAKATMEIDSVLTLKITGTEDTVKWTSSNKKIAKVSSKGKVTAVKEGTATITATVNNKKYGCHITVVDSNKKEGIWIPGYGKLVLSEKQQSLRLINPVENTVVMIYSIMNASTELFTTKEILPGEEDICNLYELLDEGKYNLKFLIRTFDVDTYEPCNGADMDVEVTVIK